MKTLLTEERFDFITPENKEFIVIFNEEMKKLGYDFGNNIDSGFCWGKYMIIYSKTGVKSKKVTARIYIRDKGLVLRLFFSNIDKHRDYIVKAPKYIKEVFTGDHGRCNHCRDDKEEICKFRKIYTIEDSVIEKCSGVTFEFWNPDLEKLPDYMNLMREFYPMPKRTK
jgi:hypothetical protein